MSFDCHFNRFPALLAGALCLFASFEAKAEEPEQADQPAIFSADAVIELQNEYTVDSDDEAIDEHNNIFLRAELAPTVRLNENFFIDGVLVLEPVQDFDADEDNFFEETGVLVEEIKLNYENGPWGVFAGKFNPVFGVAWDYGRGIWGEDFAEDYEIAERLGFGVSYTFETEKAGTHTLTGSTFFADTTFLSNSAGVTRGRTSKDDGGPSNTEDFSSFVISLDGENLAGVEKLYYKLGYRHQSEGDEDTGGDDENGGVVTLGYKLPVTDRLETDLFVEYVNISNFDAAPEDRNYLTASVGASLDEHWKGTVSFTNRSIEPDSGDDFDDNLLQVSAGYDFGQGTTAEIGWRHTDEEETETDIVGFLVRHEFSY